MKANGPKCGCGGSICGTRKNPDRRYGDVLVRKFRCHGCKRRVPWCYGAGDGMPNHCDDCWVALHKKLGAEDFDTLEHAIALRKRDAGIFPAGAGQHARFRKLERLGLIKFDAWGVDMHRDYMGRDVAIYQLTKLGESVVRAERNIPCEVAA